MVSLQSRPIIWESIGGFLIWFTITALLSRSALAPVVFAIQIALCFLTGYAVISFWRLRIGPIETLLSTILGVELITSVYALTRFFGSHSLHYAVLIAAAAFGFYRLTRAWRSTPNLGHHLGDAILDRYALMSGIVVMVTVGSAFYFSGRISSEGLTFFGPMSRDHAWHLAMIGRLEHVVPPDNYFISGYPDPSYHFFSDLGVNLFAHDFGMRNDLLDVYYRFYPSVILFAIGFLAFWVPSRLFASRTAGAIGVALILFGGDFAEFLGILQTVKALPDWGLVQQKLFGTWFSWNPVSAMYPLVHRPAYYHGLMMFLAGLALVAGRGRDSDRSWICTGLIWGLMAGYFYTFAVTIGMAVVSAFVIFLICGLQDRARQLALCAASIALASVVANFFVLGNILTQPGYSLVSTTHDAFFSWAPGAFAQYHYGWLFGERTGWLPTAGMVLILMLAVYGLRLIGLWPMLCGRGFRFRADSAVAVIVTGALLVSLGVGLLFENGGRGGGVSNNIIFFQPAGWMLALFAIFPMTRWCRRGRTWIRPTILAFILLLFPLQSLLEFNFGYKIVLGPELLAAMTRIKQQADAKDVVAFLPPRVEGIAILGSAANAANLYVPAFTGLRSYFINSGYSELYSMGDTGPEGYKNRNRIISGLLEGQLAKDDLRQLRRDGVKWIIFLGKVDVMAHDGLELWMSRPDFTILHIGAAPE